MGVVITPLLAVAAKVGDRPHVIIDTRMREATESRPSECWTLCRCGETITGASIVEMVEEFGLHAGTLTKPERQARERKRRARDLRRAQKRREWEAAAPQRAAARHERRMARRVEEEAALYAAWEREWDESFDPTRRTLR